MYMKFTRILEDSRVHTESHFNPNSRLETCSRETHIRFACINHSIKSLGIQIPKILYTSPQLLSRNNFHSQLTQPKTLVA